MEEYSLLSKIKEPCDLKALSKKELSALSEEIRRFLIERVKVNGGHLASNLGVVELTVALHRVFNSPKDHFIFDVGHQAYVHKLLTGRKDAFDTLRKPGGLSGFPLRTESEHDPFGTGHSSTSLSAALGFAEADAISGSDAYTVAVVGDGAMTGGMIHEALNNSKKSLRTVIVLNDNGMSISRNIGRFSRYLSRIRVARHYQSTKKRTKRVLLAIPFIGKPISRFISRVKGWCKRLLYTHNYFEDLGILYLGPVDGHNMQALEKAFTEAKRREGAVLVHVRTKKGKGYFDAEKDPTAYHGVSALGGHSVAATFHSVAAEELCALAKEDTRVCAVTAAMGEGTGLSAFKDTYPERFFDVGIAEAHALTFSAGLAANGLKPYFAVYSTFLQRAYDNLLHDAALQSLPVRILVDRASIAVSDGATHHGIFDVAYAATIPGVTVWAPATFGSLRAMLRHSLSFEDGPLLIRYPNAAEDAELSREFYKSGDFESFGLKISGDDAPSIAIASYGKVTSEALLAARMLREDGVRVRVILLERLAPFKDTARELLAALEGAALVFVEEGVYGGGAGMHILAALSELSCGCASLPVRLLAVRDGFAVLQGKGEPYDELGIGADAIVKAAFSLIDRGELAEKQ